MQALAKKIEDNACTKGAMKRRDRKWDWLFGRYDF